MQRLIK